jgi:SOS-response transcriptional repressor LexA
LRHDHQEIAMSWHTVDQEFIERFKSTWPCHGLPDDLCSLSIETASNGDLVDIEARIALSDGSVVVVDTAEFDGSALKALVDDCQEFGQVEPRQPAAPKAS